MLLVRGKTKSLCTTSKCDKTILDKNSRFIRVVPDVNQCTVAVLQVC